MHTAPNTPTSLVPPQGGHWLGALLLALLAHPLFRALNTTACATATPPT